MNIVFNKLSDTVYIAVYPENYIEDKVDTILKNISNDIVYMKETSSYLEEQLVSRIVSADFNKQFPNMFDTITTMFVNINVNYKSKSLEITTSKVLYNNELQVVNGVLYK